MLISDFLDSNTTVKLVIAAAFIGLALIVFLRQPGQKVSAADAPERAFFRRGLFIAALNPQAIPFWIFALAAISQYREFHYEGLYLVMFLMGVFAGKFVALYGYVIASGYVKAHLAESSRLVNQVLAAVLLIIGLAQGWNALQGVG